MSSEFNPIDVEAPADGVHSDRLVETVRSQYPALVALLSDPASHSRSEEGEMETQLRWYWETLH